ncbi:MAG: hypothetical protein IJT51_07545 [Bacteroidales bacterium]|nr:hypothetical protein [Bacteroidales bacterium]
MKKNICIICLFLVSLLFSFKVAAQDSINPNGYNRFRYPNGQISSEGWLKDGKPEGWWKSYNENGTLVSEGNRINHLLDSTWTFYNNDGAKTLVINYKKGKKNGERIQYSAEEYTVENWVEDTITGNVSTFSNDGRLLKTVPYLEGKPHGIGKQYNDEGTVTTITHYFKGVMTKRERINRKDKSGLRQGNWKFFWDNGNLKQEGTYLNDKKHGFFKDYDEDGNFLAVYKYQNDELVEDAKETKKLDKKTAYHPNGKIAITATYYKGQPEGVRREYDTNGVLVKGYLFENGILRYEGITDENGLRQGLWKEYYETGELRAKGKYKNSMPIDDWVFYLPNKTVEIEGEYDKKGRKTGEWKWYYANGELLAIENYEAGQLDGEFVEYDEEQNVLTKGQYVEGQEDGEWVYRNGEITERGQYYDGQRTGTWKTWYGNGKLASECQFEQGLLDGKYKIYWENGNEKLSGRYVSGERYGIWYQYDEDGALLLTTEYRDGFEIRWNNYQIED